MVQFIPPGIRPVNSSADLDALPIGSVVETGSGLRYARATTGRWVGRATRIGVGSEVLLDPNHSVQPITVRYVAGVSDD
jgi:hypothetical protein